MAGVEKVVGWKGGHIWWVVHICGDILEELLSCDVLYVDEECIILGGGAVL